MFKGYYLTSAIFIMKYCLPIHNIIAWHLLTGEHDNQ